MLCISGGGDNTNAFIRLGNEKKLSDTTLKICGYRFGHTPGVTEQMNAIEQKFNDRIWVLRNLRRSGFTKTDLNQVYTSLIRPIFDYTAVVYHSLLSLDQKSHLERLQRRALAVITGSQHTSYAGDMEMLGLESLESRRLSLVDTFIEKSLQHPTFGPKWFSIESTKPI